jgi:hypothetical protein
MPEGVKLIGQWSYTGGGRTFTLFEADDALTMAQVANRWNDLGKSEVFPVIETDELTRMFHENVESAFLDSKWPIFGSEQSQILIFSSKILAEA